MAKEKEVKIKIGLDTAEAQKKASGLFGDLKSKAKEAGQGFSELGALAKASLVGMVITGATMAVKALVDVGKAIVEIGREASKFQSVQNAFGAMARGIGQDADVMLQKMREGIKGTVNDLTLMTEANKAMMLGLDMGRVDEMMGIALAASKATGQSVEQTTAAVLGGLAEQKANMLESVGITFDANAAYNEYAKSLGKTADQLTNAEKKQAFLNEALKVGGQMAESIGTKGLLTFNQSISAIGSSIDNMKAKISTSLLPTFTALASMANDFFAKQEKNINNGDLERYDSLWRKIGSAVVYVGSILSDVFEDMNSGGRRAILDMQKMELGWKRLKIAMGDFRDAYSDAFSSDEALQRWNREWDDINQQIENYSVYEQSLMDRDWAGRAAKSVEVYEGKLKALDEQAKKSGESVRTLGSALDNVKPPGSAGGANDNFTGGGGGEGEKLGMDIGAEVSGKIDAMSGITGLGGGVTGVVGMAVEGAIQSYTTMLNAEAQFLAVRSQKVSYFADLFIGLAQKQKEMEIQTAQEKWDSIIEKEKEGFAALQTQIEDNMTAHIEQINAGYAQQLFSTEEKETKIVQAQKFAQEQKDKNTKEYNKKMAQTEKEKNAEMKRLADEKEAQDSAMRKQRAMITWMIQAAQLEAQKRIQIAQVTISTASSAAQALGMSIGMLGPIAGTVVGAGLAANIIAAGEMSKAAIMSQVALPPSDLFLADGGIVMPRPGGVQATIAEAGQPEAVIPLDRMGSMGGVTINVQNLYATEDLPERLVDMIDQELYKRARVGQSVFASEVAR